MNVSKKSNFTVSWKYAYIFMINEDFFFLVTHAKYWCVHMLEIFIYIILQSELFTISIL